MSLLDAHSDTKAPTASVRNGTAIASAMCGLETDIAAAVPVCRQSIMLQINSTSY